MPQLQAHGFDSLFPLADILRLFFGPVRETGLNSLSAGTDDREITISCRPDKNSRFIITTSVGDILESREVGVADIRRESKRQLYLVLVRLTGQNWPWGSLTGIRPTQIALRCLEQEGSRQKAVARLTGHWLVSPPRAELALRTALAEAKQLRRIPADSLGVYIGIPFCPSRCAYCSFISHDTKNQIRQLAAYTRAVTEEARALFADCDRQIACLYIGGGTPTCLPADLLDSFMGDLRDILDFSRIGEITVEAGRPDTINAEKLRILRAAGVGRVCVNPQTFQDRTLRLIGREHTGDEAIRAVRLAQNAGFPAINMDLIAGLPGESTDDFLGSLQTALDLDPGSITIHTLALKRGSFLQAENMKAADSTGLRPELAAALTRAYAHLDANQYFPYYLYRQKRSSGGLENVGFARSGQECLYNVAMMSDARTIVGLGAGAMSKWQYPDSLVRKANPRAIDLYLQNCRQLGAGKREILAKISCRLSAPGL